MRGRSGAVLAAVVAGLALGGPAGAQQPDSVPAPGPARASVVQPADFPSVSPGGAFLRSILIPGWGHAAVGAYTRGAFYFSAASGTGWMLMKSSTNRAAAEQARDVRAETVAAQLRLAGHAEDSIPLLVEADESVIAAQSLVDSRSQQVQDWAALGVFILLLSGADAFVSAHLMDFPEPLTVDAVPGQMGRIEVGVELPVGGPGG